MRRSKRSFKAFRPLYAEVFILEERVLPSLAVSYVTDQVPNDYVGPDAGVGPDGRQDIHLGLTGLDTTPNVFIDYITVTNTSTSGFKWESDHNPTGAANAFFLRSLSINANGDVFINPTIKSNTSGTLISPGSSTGDSVTVTAGDALQVTIHYSYGTTTWTDSKSVNAGTIPGIMPTITSLPSVNTSALSVTSSTQSATTGEVTLTVTGLSGTGLTTNFSDVLWVLSDPAGITWDSSSGSVGHEHITATVNGNTATLTYPQVRDELSALEGNPSNGTMMLTASHSAQGSTLYTSAFIGAGFDATYGTDSLPGSTFYATSLNLATLASELQDPNSSYGTISLPANTTLTLRNPLKIAHSVKFVGNGATLLFEQLSTDPAWPAEATGAIYFASNLGPKNLRLEFENFTIRFGTASLRWKNSDNTDWYPSDSTHSAPKAVIQAREGHDNRSRDYIRLDGMTIHGPPAFDTATHTLSSEYVDVGERAIDILTASDYAKGIITNSEFQGGPVTVFGGPWVVSNNVVKGSFAKTYSPSAFAFETPHDIQLIDNTVSQVDSLGTLFRLTNLSVCGFNDVIARNAVSGGVGTIGNQAMTWDRGSSVFNGTNNPEVILAEANRVAFEGQPRVVSADGRLLTIQFDANYGAAPDNRLVVSILADTSATSHVGTWYQVAHLVAAETTSKTLTFLMRDPLPTLPSGGYVISLAKGFLHEQYVDNVIDLTGKTSLGIALSGTFGAEVSGNTITGGTVFHWPVTGTGFLLGAPPANALSGSTIYSVNSWTVAPSFGVIVEGNQFKNSMNSIQVKVEHTYSASKSSASRNYINASILNNEILWTRSFYDDSSHTYLYTGQQTLFPTVTIGEGFNTNPAPASNDDRVLPWTVVGPGGTAPTRGFVDPVELKATVVGNAVNILESNGSKTPLSQSAPAGQVYAGIVNGTTYAGSLAVAARTDPQYYNYRNLDIAGAGINPDIVDDSNPAIGGFATTGSWSSWTAVGYQGDCATAAGVGPTATPTATATWTFSVTPGQYQVWAIWVQANNRANDAPFTILDGTTSVGTVRVDQTLAPGATGTYAVIDGAIWRNLQGTYTISGNQLVVQLANNASGIVVADGVRIVRVSDLIVDDAATSESGFSKSGTWTYYINSGYRGDTQGAAAVSPTATPTATATWTFDVAPGRYTVWTLWQQAPNHANDAPFTVLDGTTVLGTDRINQTVAPINSGGNYSWHEGGAWRQVGATYTITGNSILVRLANNASGEVIADGVRVERVDDMTVDDASPAPEAGFSKSGAWDYWSSTGYRGDTQTAPNSGGTRTATWTFNVTPGLYRVWATWVPDTNRATNAPFTIFDGTTSLGSVSVNQRVDPSASGGNYDYYDGSVWQILNGVYAITGTQLVVQLSNSGANGIVVADGIHLVRVSDLLIDNAMPNEAGFSTSGTWSYWTNSGYRGDSQTASNSGGAATATWTFNVVPGLYRVMTNWVQDGTRATNAPYTVFDGSTSLGTFQVDQTVAPNAGGTYSWYEGGAWRHLGSVHTITGTQLVVQLSNSGANGVVVADAVRIEPVNPLELAAGSGRPASDSVPITQAQLRPLIDEALARWAAAGIDRSQLQELAAVSYHIEDLPRPYLGVASEIANEIWIDDDAAGRGWFVDPTPRDDREFERRNGVSTPDGVDLLTVLTHELGHLLGLDDLDPHTIPGSVMTESLAPGARRMPTSRATAIHNEQTVPRTQPVSNTARADLDPRLMRSNRGNPALGSDFLGMFAESVNSGRQSAGMAAADPKHGRKPARFLDTAINARN